MMMPRSFAFPTFLVSILLLTQPSFSQLPDCGINWDAPIQISSDHVLSNASQVAVSGETIHIVWYGLDTLGTEPSDGVQYARSIDGGTTFSPQLTISSIDTAASPAS